MRLDAVQRWYQRLLASVSITLLIGLAGVVLYAVVARTLGASPIWYDEVASIMLAWLTFLGAALAVLRNGHLGFDGILVNAPPRVRFWLFVLGEAIFHITLVTIAWAGWQILAVLGDETLTSLRWVTLAFTQSVMPIGCALCVLARLIVTPANWRRIAAGLDIETEEIAAEIARTQR